MSQIKLLSWNVNGIRAAERKGFLNWFNQARPNFLGMQETKAHSQQLSRNLLDIPGYHIYYRSGERKGYSGTGVFTNLEPENLEYGLGEERFDNEGRLIITHYPQFTILNVYVPNGGQENRRVPYKLEYLDKLLEKSENFRKQGRKVILCGDFNIAHKEIDLARPKQNRKNTGFLPEECAWMDKFVAHGYIDTFRYFYPDETEAYSWWSMRLKARERNVGWRLDYFFISPDLVNNLISAFILSNIQGSDHCPVGIEMKF